MRALYLRFAYLSYKVSLFSPLVDAQLYKTSHLFFFKYSYYFAFKDAKLCLFIFLNLYKIMVESLRTEF